MSGSDKSPLGDKRKLFIAEYLKDLNATRAAERAGYKHPNVTGPTLVNTSVVRNEIDRQLRLRIMTPEEVLERLTDQAKADYSAYFDVNGNVRIADLLRDGKGHLIKGTKRDRDGNLVVEFYDGQKALSLMAKHQGLLNETRTDLQVNVNELTTEQLERIANGEDALHVLATSREEGQGIDDPEPEPDEEE